MRQRGERIERSFAHLYDTGGMRRTHLRGHTNILKRLLIHAGGFNLGLVMRHLIGSGTPRGLQNRPATFITTLLMFLGATRRWLVTISAWQPILAATRPVTSPTTTTGDLTGDHLHHGLLSPVARSLVLEALVGQLFPVILIARLVAMEIEYHRSRQP